jgi:hypothetical protein
MAAAAYGWVAPELARAGVRNAWKAIPPQRKSGLGLQNSLENKSFRPVIWSGYLVLPCPLKATKNM